MYVLGRPSGFSLVSYLLVLGRYCLCLLAFGRWRQYCWIWHLLATIKIFVLTILTCIYAVVGPEKATRAVEKQAQKHANNAAVVPIPLSSLEGTVTTLPPQET